MSCKTKAVIYLITCPRGKSYIGKTICELKMRIAEHQTTIRCRNMNYPLAAHLTEFNHPITSLRYIGIERVFLQRRWGDLDPILLKQEAYWTQTKCWLWSKLFLINMMILVNVYRIETFVLGNINVLCT